MRGMTCARTKTSKVPTQVRLLLNTYTVAEDSINNMISELNAYMKRKIKKEFQIRFNSKNIQIMKAFEALDASKPCYLDINTLDYLVQHFDCLGINRSIPNWNCCVPQMISKRGYRLAKRDLLT